MSKDATIAPTAAETAQIEAAIKELLSEIEQANKQMKSDQKEIDKLKSQTRAILARLQTA